MVDTSGEFSCGNERIIGTAVRSVRAVASLYVTVLGSAAYIGARYLVRVWRGSRRDLTLSEDFCEDRHPVVVDAEGQPSSEAVAATLAEC